MMRKAHFESLPFHRQPAVCRLALSAVVLGLLNRGVMENSNHAFHVLQQLPSPPIASHVDTDVTTLDILHLTAQGYLTNTGKAVADLQLSAEEGVILLSAAFLGVGRFACWLLAATSSVQLLESISKTSPRIDAPPCAYRLVPVISFCLLVSWKFIDGGIHHYRRFLIPF